MVKVIDAIHDTMVKLENDVSNFLAEDFMNNILSRIGTNENGNKAPLESLADAMMYQFEEKRTSTMDESKVLPFGRHYSELFYPDRQESNNTTIFVEKLAVEVAQCSLQ